MGLTVYKRYLSSNLYCVKKYLKGIFKTKENKNIKKYYFFGIRFLKKYKKVTYDMIKECINDSSISYQINNAIKNMTKINQRLIMASNLHQKTFLPYKGIYKGKDVVLVGAGPTVNYFEPIKNAIYVGCNRAFLKEDINFDYLFTIDKGGLYEYGKDFFNYKPESCVKFVGDQNLGKDFQIPENNIPLNENVKRYITYAGIEEASEFNLDIASLPLHNAATVTLQALQFILYTQPKRIYIVGIDCTTASKQYFKGSAFDNSARNENSEKLDNININLYKKIKEFADTYYPETEIISINPVGLKDVFKDEYTESFLNKEEFNEYNKLSI